MSTSLELIRFALCFPSQSLACLHATSLSIQMFGKLDPVLLEKCVLCKDISPKPGKKAVQVPALNGLQKRKNGLCRQAGQNQPARAMTGCIKSCLAALTC